MKFSSGNDLDFVKLSQVRYMYSII